MNTQLFNSDQKRPTGIKRFDIRASFVIQNHFGLNKNQLMVLIWFKGIWTGILLSLVLHYFITH